MKGTAEIKRFKRKLTVDLLWVYILSILRKKPMHAYALRKEIKKKFGFLPGNVSAYVVLYKLAGRGYVSSKAVGTRKMYNITKKGKKLFSAAKAEFKGMQKKLFN